jgi:hypothetical protein
VPKHGERAAESADYVHVPRQRTQLTYSVDEALKKTGFTLRTAHRTGLTGERPGNGPRCLVASLIVRHCLTNLKQSTRLVKLILTGAM